MVFMHMYFAVVLRNMQDCAWWKSLVDTLHSLVAVTTIPLWVRLHVSEKLWMFHVNLRIENPQCQQYG